MKKRGAQAENHVRAGDLPVRIPDGAVTFFLKKAPSEARCFVVREGTRVNEFTMPNFTRAAIRQEWGDGEYRVWFRNDAGTMLGKGRDFVIVPKKSTKRRQDEPSSPAAPVIPNIPGASVEIQMLMAIQALTREDRLAAREQAALQIANSQAFMSNMMAMIPRLMSRQSKDDAIVTMLERIETRLGALEEGFEDEDDEDELEPEDEDEPAEERAAPKEPIIQRNGKVNMSRVAEEAVPMIKEAISQGGQILSKLADRQKANSEAPAATGDAPAAGQG